MYFIDPKFQNSNILYNTWSFFLLVISQKIWSDFFFPFHQWGCFWKSVESNTPQMDRKYENNPKCTATFSKPGFHTPSTGWEQPTNTSLQTTTPPYNWHHKNGVHKNHNLLFSDSLSSNSVLAHTLQLDIQIKAI